MVVVPRGGYTQGQAARLQERAKLPACRLSRAMPPPPRSRAALAVLVLAAALLAVATNTQRSAAAQAQSPVYHDNWAADDDDDAGYGYGYGVACTGTVGDCAEPRTRRELGGGGFIGYNALQKDRAPCSYRGASYYNCGPSGAANPYSRGCSAIAQCRG